MKPCPVLIIIVLVGALILPAAPLWADSDNGITADPPAADNNFESGDSVETDQADNSDPFGDEQRFPGWRFFGIGPNWIELSGTGPKLDRVSLGHRAGPGLALHYSEKYTSNLSLDVIGSYSQVGFLVLANVLVGMKYDISAFPKTAVTPWGGLYLSANHLDDRSNPEEWFSGEEDWDGFGVGGAVAVGVSVRLSEDFILQASVRRNRFGALFTLENFDAGADRITATEYSLKIVLYEDMEDTSTYMVIE